MTTTRRPRHQLRTHTVRNVPGEPDDANLYQDDAILQAYVRGAGAADHELHLTAFGEAAGRREMFEQGQLANANTPSLQTFDRFGRRIDQVDFHPAWHQLMKFGLGNGVSSRAWTHAEGGHVAHSALIFMMSQIEPGVTCPMSMTYACVPALRHAPELAAIWEPLILASDYDPRLIPTQEKTAATIGMAMTEKQGGSDVRANATRVSHFGEGHVELTGHKWFCSAPMSDAFLTLAKEDAGLSCFLLPRWRPDGERNTIELQRLKDKMGDRANASAEIELQGAYAVPIGDPGTGLTTILEMVNHTRLDCAVGAASLMRQALSLAVYHSQKRMAFGKPLIKQPLMRRVLADMALEVEGHVALVFLLAETLDHSRHEQAAQMLARSLTPLTKYWVTKRCPAVVAEAMECLGGAGFIEDQLLTRIYRQAPLNGIWEGAGNVIALDLLRAFQKEPDSQLAMIGLLTSFGTKHPVLLEHCKVLIKALSGNDMTPNAARWMAESLGKVVTAAALFHYQQEDLATDYVETRLTQSSMSLGAHRRDLDERLLIERSAIFS